ncbi:hypothetical protein TIFTF001_025704 [Ficus carica]|uniref:Uncharacterized protein n=1 Tax=Ficus carica TaxID=3494 RepID=A0AA88AX54_FICCA|nr:hypothetical protein TIFTF001_025704 [Ficus carica]
MAFIHKFLNLVLPLSSLITILLFLPPFLVYKLFKYSIKAFTHTENLAGKVVLITGASSGIGEHLAYEYAKRGASLALAARREDRLQSVAAKSVRLGSPDAFVIRADVSKVEDCKRLVDQTVNHFGQLDYLVNNAGVLQANLIEDSIEFSKIRSIMDINFWGSVYCTQFAIPHLRKGKGKIVVVSSIGTYLSPPRLGVYSASKAAQLCFFEALKAELGSEIGITIATPGLIESEMTGDHFFSQTKLKGFPVGSAEGCAKAIVESACRGDMYLTVPYWWRVGFWFKLMLLCLSFGCIRILGMLGRVSKSWSSNGTGVGVAFWGKGRGGFRNGGQDWVSGRGSELGFVIEVQIRFQNQCQGRVSKSSFGVKVGVWFRDMVRVVFQNDGSGSSFEVGSGFGIRVMFRDKGLSGFGVRVRVKFRVGFWGKGQGQELGSRSSFGVKVGVGFRSQVSRHGSGSGLGMR